MVDTEKKKVAVSKEISRKSSATKGKKRSSSCGWTTESNTRNEDY